jgi:sarcosine oxidase
MWTRKSLMKLGAAAVVGHGSFTFLQWRERGTKTALALAPPAAEHVVIVGGGVMGAATAWQLSRRDNVRVTLIDTGHSIRSSWGDSRIARLAYMDELYVRMARRAFKLYDLITQDAGGDELVKRTGSLDFGPLSVVQRLIDTYDNLKVPYEVLTPAATAARFPFVRLLDDQVGLFQESGSVVLADTTVVALTTTAERRGAVILDESVCAIDTAARIVTTEEGTVVEYDKLVLTAGPWTNRVLAMAGLPLLPLVVTNEQKAYFGLKDDADAAAHDVGTMPTAIERNYATKKSQVRFNHARLCQSLLAFAFATKHSLFFLPFLKPGLSDASHARWH